ncbi:MAG TPA: isoprenylcysteine carboxylmethyltransferase family protein [Candidatus Dormibacteraeota bacterium]
MSGVEEPQIDLRLLVAEFGGMLVVAAAILFGVAGTIAWPAGWIFLVLFFGLGAALTVWLVRHDPGLVVERMTGVGKPDRGRWDRAFVVVASVLLIGWLALVPLDAVRFGWSHVPAPVQVAGAVLFLASLWLQLLVFRENSFLSSAVRIQSERGQKVVDTGPYRHVRHPLYASLLGLLVGATLMLGSWLGLLVVLVLTAAVAARAMDEERRLLRDLPGYDAYAARVRYRLVPRMW